MLLNLVPKFNFVWIVSCSWNNHTTLLLMFVAEKVLLLLMISLTDQARDITLPDRYLTFKHYNDVIMSAMASQITGISIVCSTVCLGANQRKHQSSVSLVFVRGIHRWRVDSPHNGLVMRKCPHLMTSSWYKLPLLFETLFEMDNVPTDLVEIFSVFDVNAKLTKPSCPG